MTDTTPAPVVRPAPESRFEQLCAEYDRLKPLVTQYTAELKAITDALKIEMISQQPNAERILLYSMFLDKPLQLLHTTAWRLDSKRLKADHPETWVRYATQSSSWRLEAVAE
jgi:hypothetical protein